MNKFQQIAKFGKKLMMMEKIEEHINLISIEAKSLLNADRCSIFIVDAQEKMLWTMHSDGMGRIVLSLDSGIVGDTYKKQKAQIVNTPYDDPRFLKNIDKKSGYVTINMITVPIFGSKQDVIGIIQLLNKSRGDYDSADLDTLTFFANYVSGSIELVLMNEK